MRRVAIIVGANAAAPGRRDLRFAHADAQRLADVLTNAGHFRQADVHVLLDPSPSALFAELDHVQAASDDRTLFVFYYSGHSDGQSVFPRGQTMAIRDLRERLARMNARIRVGILDTCRGGGWTQAKGLTVGPPLDPVDLLNVTTEGTALLSSSSGFENAHEAEVLQGSFFTHHLASGLRGAADRSGDGSVTLQEAFEYAKERTVRDSARLAGSTQHPSFDLQLRGRQDVVLTQIAASPSGLRLSGISRGLEVIHLQTGATVIEVPPGKTELRVALPPGRYLVRRVADGRVFTKEVEIQAGSTPSLDERDLEATGDLRLALKSDEDPRPFAYHSTPPKGVGQIALAIGVSTGPSRYDAPIAFGRDKSELQRSVEWLFSIQGGITDRWMWLAPAPAFAYRIGTEGTFEIIPRGGFLQFDYDLLAEDRGITGVADMGFATRTWTAPAFSLVSAAHAQYGFATNPQLSLSPRKRGWLLHTSFGVLWTIQNAVTLHFGLGYEASPDSDRPDQTFARKVFIVGASQSLGYRSLPLIQVHVSRRVSLDLYATWSIDTRGVRDRYLGGVTWAF